jgi:DAK2 domain fusion protein YloV
VLDSLDAAAIHRWCEAGLEALRRHQDEINELNVYPVPDGDTGTNLVLTVTSAWEALAEGHDAQAGTELGRALHGMARGALLGARGNSGVIISQLLRGLADTLGDVPAARGRAMADALTAAAKAGYGAVANPVEGTVLSVATAAAAQAAAADSDDLPTVVRAAAEGAATALARTPDQLAVLARAGVVDAGGRGLVVLLDTLVEVVTGQAPRTRPAEPLALPAVNLTRETGSDAYGYEVQYLLDAPDSAITQLRATLGALGDSLVVVGTAGQDRTWNVHVHVNDVGAAIEAGVRAGRPHRISVTRFADTVETGIHATGSREPDTEAAGTRVTGSAQILTVQAPPSPDPAARGFVVVAGGPGLADLFAGEGAVVVDGGPTDNPSTADVLAAIQATGAGQVAVLPNDRNSLAVATAAAEEARAGGLRVSVVPTRSPVQALAALAVRDPRRRFSDDTIAMAEAAGACRYAEVTVATREALTMAGRCRPGDVLALLEGEVILVGGALPQVCLTLLDRMLSGGGELVTLVLGEQAGPSLGDELCEHLAQRWPFVESTVYRGGQPHYPLLVGVE